MSTIHVGDCRLILPQIEEESVDCIVTSPPYWGLRDYGIPEQIGLEATSEAYVQQLVGVFRAARRVLRPCGTLWLNLGDTYCTGSASLRQRAGSNGHHEALVESGDVPTRAPNRQSQEDLKPKDMAGLPWRVALALQADGWWLRSAIVWHKPNPLPEPVRDRPTRSYEFIFLLSKSSNYYYDFESIEEAAISTSAFVPSHSPGTLGAHASHQRRRGQPLPARTTRNARDVWSIAPDAGSGHSATMPLELARRCVRAGCPVQGMVLDPFGGAGTTALASLLESRRSVLIEINPEYAELARERLYLAAPLLKHIEEVAS